MKTQTKTTSKVMVGTAVAFLAVSALAAAAAAGYGGRRDAGPERESRGYLPAYNEQRQESRRDRDEERRERPEREERGFFERFFDRGPDPSAVAIGGGPEDNIATDGNLVVYENADFADANADNPTGKIGDVDLVFGSFGVKATEKTSYLSELTVTGDFQVGDVDDAVDHLELENIATGQFWEGESVAPNQFLIKFSHPRPVVSPTTSPLIFNILADPADTILDSNVNLDFDGVVYPTDVKYFDSTWSDKGSVSLTDGLQNVYIVDDSEPVLEPGALHIKTGAYAPADQTIEFGGEDTKIESEPVLFAFDLVAAADKEDVYLSKILVEFENQDPSAFVQTCGLVAGAFEYGGSGSGMKTAAKSWSSGMFLQLSWDIPYIISSGETVSFGVFGSEFGNVPKDNPCVMNMSVHPDNITTVASSTPSGKAPSVTGMAVSNDVTVTVPDVVSPVLDWAPDTPYGSASKGDDSTVAKFIVSTMGGEKEAQAFSIDTLPFSIYSTLELNPIREVKVYKNALYNSNLLYKTTIGELVGLPAGGSDLEYLVLPSKEDFKDLVVWFDDDQKIIVTLDTDDANALDSICIQPRHEKIEWFASSVAPTTGISDEYGLIPPKCLDY